MVTLVMSVILTACAQISNNETQAAANDSATTEPSEKATTATEKFEQTEKPEKENGEHPSIPQVSVKIDGEVYDVYHELSSHSIGGVIADGYDILMSNYIPKLDDVEYVHFCADSTLEITTNGSYPQRIEVFDGETNANITETLGKFDLSELGNKLYQFKVLSSLYISGNFVIKFQSTTHGTGDFANEYYTEVYFIYLTINGDQTYIPQIDTGMVCYKPIIYFYPTQDIDLTVKYANSERLLTTYPKYNGAWNVHVSTDGTLTDENGRHYYALYFDEISGYECAFDKGFYVDRENAAAFLEEKLAILGFTERESNEFIMFWLPVLEQNEHNLVYFEQTAERNSECPLEYSVEPDSVLRVIIHIKAVGGYTEIEEQTLDSFERNGFTVVEWGGTKY